MKTKKLFIICTLISVLLITLFSCKEDDKLPNVDSEPVFEDLKTKVSSLPGEVFIIQGNIQDKAGIKSIHLLYENWSLDKTIVKNSKPTDYFLKYSFKVPEDAKEGSEHKIIVTAENIGGRTTQNEITVTLDADITPPTINVISPVDGATVQIGDGNEIDFNIELADKSLKSFSIESDILSETLELSGEKAAYTKSLDIADEMEYTFILTAIDQDGNKAEKTITVNVVDELSFRKMYLADSNDESSLSEEIALTGYPYLTTASSEAGEEGFVFSIQYYAEADNTKVWFIPQKRSFIPFAFGKDPASDGKLVIGNDATITPITLPTKGYYDISININALTYSVDPVTPPAPRTVEGDFSNFGIVGDNITVNGVATTGFAPAKTIPLTANADNMRRYSADITFEGENGSFIFNGNQSNWKVFWRVDTGLITETTALVPQGGANCEFQEQYEGTYKLTIDLFLNSITIIKKP